MFEFLCPESDNRDSEYSRIIIIVIIIIIIIITRCLKTHFTTYGSLNAFYNKLFT